MTSILKLINPRKLGSRVWCLTSETANAFHRPIHAILFIIFINSFSISSEEVYVLTLNLEFTALSLAGLLYNLQTSYEEPTYGTYKTEQHSRTSIIGGDAQTLLPW